MANRILTTHVGSLPRPAKMIELNHKRADGEKVDEAALRPRAQEPRSSMPSRSRRRPASTSSTTASSATTWAGTTTTARGGPMWCGGSTASRSQPKPLWMQNLTAQTKHGLAPNDFSVGEWMDRRDWKIFEEAYMDPRSGLRAARAVHDPLQSGGDRPDHLQGPGRDQARHRQPQGRARSRRHQGRRLDELGRAGKLLAHGERALQDRRRADVSPAPTRCARSTRRSSTPG